MSDLILRDIMKITPIRTNEDYERTLRRIEEIFDAKPGTDEGDELEVLSILVDEYERREFPIDLPTPLEALKFRMDQLGMEQKDLAKLLGSRSHTSEILSGKRPLSLNHMRILYRELGIPAEVFIRAEAEPKIDIQRSAIKRQLNIERSHELRESLLPYGEKKGWFTDEDVFREVS